MYRHEITNDGFVIVDNQSMTNLYNYDLTVIDIFNINVKITIKNLILSPLWQNNTEVVN